jgi:asparagine synthase (glutamine-hydrolysing)
MCGIAGIVGEFRPGLISRMNRVQAHRGPDGAGVFEDPAAGVALGHVRLAILDLSTQAAQPMTTADGRYTLIFNGEVYNYVELRRDLESRGCTFRSRGDTEVLLQGLARHGAPFVERLNGMFAFALWDATDHTLLLARDHLGVKPLYYAEPSPGVLVFASELKAICAHPHVKREPDFTAIEQHLTFCHASADRTVIRAIRRVPPATMMFWSERTRRTHCTTYWKASYGTRQDLRRDEAVVELRETVAAATKRQMVSDVPVGALLSGGLDSSLITA